MYILHLSTVLIYNNQFSLQKIICKKTVLLENISSVQTD